MWILLLPVSSVSSTLMMIISCGGVVGDLDWFMEYLELDLFIWKPRSSKNRCPIQVHHGFIYVQCGTSGWPTKRASCRLTSSSIMRWNTVRWYTLIKAKRCPSYFIHCEHKWFLLFNNKILVFPNWFFNVWIFQQNKGVIRASCLSLKREKCRKLSIIIDRQAITPTSQNYPLEKKTVSSHSCAFSDVRMFSSLT